MAYFACQVVHFRYSRRLGSRIQNTFLYRVPQGNSSSVAVQANAATRANRERRFSRHQGNRPRPHLREYAWKTGKECCLVCPWPWASHSQLLWRYCTPLAIRHSMDSEGYYQPCWYSDELEIVNTFQPHEHASELHDCYGLLAFAIEIRVVFLELGILAQETI